MEVKSNFVPRSENLSLTKKWKYSLYHPEDGCDWIMYRIKKFHPKELLEIMNRLIDLGKKC